ncbi:MAG: precorrin-8X methylmutase [Syntrophomonadaceae bacterium]|nr:precorrin-8X methylmutase [Syntrophomonadaceae bacterium]
MKVELPNMLPADIEKRSFEIIGQELGAVELDPREEAVLKRVIHTTADFDYANNLKFSKDAVVQGLAALKKGAVIVSDTEMVRAGVHKPTLAALGGEILCFMGDADIAARARANGTTRASASIDKAAELDRPLIFAIGNAPTALVRIYELVQEGCLKPELIIGVPVGFVNVVEAKEFILQMDIPHIVAQGRKGGSNVAAAICNAMLYLCRPRE